jgi:hypothetical protein
LLVQARAEGTLVPDGHLDLAVVCESRDSRAYYLNRVVVWVRQAEAGHDPQAVADLFPCTCCSRLR